MKLGTGEIYQGFCFPFPQIIRILGIAKHIIGLAIIFNILYSIFILNNIQIFKVNIKQHYMIQQ